MQVDEKMIPAEVVEAAARAAMDDAGWHWDTADEARRNIWRRTARAAILAMLEAWPGVNTDAVRCGTIILHLPNENPDDKA